MYDQLQQDRQNGTLEGQDSRATRGQIFAIGADAGFAAAGAFTALATYNFIRDPLPESSVALGKLLEFEDPMKARPVALRAPVRARSERQAQAEAPRLQFLPQASGSGAGLFVGGHF